MEKEKVVLTEKDLELKEAINKALDEKFPDRSKMITVTRIEPIVVPPSVNDTVTVLKRKPSAKSKAMKVLRWIDQEMTKIIIFTILGLIILVFGILLM